MRVLVVVLLVGIAGCGSSSPEQKAAAKKSVEGQETLTLKGRASEVYSVSFSPDGKRIVTGGGGSGTVKVWDAQTGQETLTLMGHSGRVTSVSFSPDGKRIVSGGGYRTAVFAGLRGVVKVWDISSLDTSK